VLRDVGALGGASDHGVSKSLYGADPDGNEFEIMWRVPREQWGDMETDAVIAPLDIAKELREYGGVATGDAE
jgi:catechol-2,3-dioxygenase